MAASDPNPQLRSGPAGARRACPRRRCASALEEEIGRAERHGTRAELPAVVIENLDELAREHGGELREQTLAYIAGALRRELRRFDRIGQARASASC